MAAAFKSVANNQTQISVLRLTSKSSWVWFAIARIKNCNQTFGNEAEKQLCFSFLKSFMVQLSSCIIVAKKVSYCMIGQARSFAPVVLCLSLHCCVRSSLRDWIGAGQEDQTFLSLEQMPSLWKMKWIYNSIIIFQLVCCCSLVLCWIFLSTFSLNKFHRWDLASESHTKSFIEEVLRWEIDLDGKTFQRKTNKSERFESVPDFWDEKTFQWRSCSKESHDKHFQLLREDRINGGTAWLTFYVNTFSSFCLSRATRNYEQRQKETCTLYNLWSATQCSCFSQTNKKECIEASRLKTLNMLKQNNEKRRQESDWLKQKVQFEAKRAETVKQNPWWEPNTKKNVETKYKYK